MQSNNSERTFFGHPMGLLVCFFTEMWERFSFYGMKALMIFYLTKYHLFADNEAYGIKGSYAALVYALPLLGGMIADKYLGFRKAVFFGAILLTIGHAGMAFEGHAASLAESGEVLRDDIALQVFYLSLGFIIMGVGFLKPNISSIVGELYEQDDPLRSKGFNIFYMGINAGSFFATLICGYLGETLGWSWGFGAAGVGMFIGLVVFKMGEKYLHNVAEPPKTLPIKTEYTIYALAVVTVLMNMFLVQNESVVGWILGLAAVTSLTYIIYQTLKREEHQDINQWRTKRNHMFILILMICSSTFFWSLFEQSYNSMNLYADRVVDRDIAFNLGFINVDTNIPASVLIGLNPLFIILLVPVINVFFSFLIKKGLDPNPLMKFSFALVLVGLGFGLLVLGIKTAQADLTNIVKVSMLYIVGAYLLHTIGELLLSPVGLSTVSQFSIKSLLGLMMGTWFLATAGSEFVAAQLSKLASVETSGSGTFDITVAMNQYAGLFNFLLYTGVISGCVLFILSIIFKNTLKTQVEKQ